MRSHESLTQVFKWIRDIHKTTAQINDYYFSTILVLVLVLSGLMTHQHKVRIRCCQFWSRVCLYFHETWPHLSNLLWTLSGVLEVTRDFQDKTETESETNWVLEVLLTTVHIRTDIQSLSRKPAVFL